ncbi:MAG: hypothetical protein ABIK12_00315 [Pseudomonadota bacterium]
MGEFKLAVGKKDLSKTLVDDGTGVEIKFSYRRPTNNERITYQRKAIKSKGKKIVLKNAAAAREMIKPLLTGFSFPNPDPDTQILIEVEGGLVPLSCANSDPGYVEAWREALDQGVPQMLENLGQKIFAGVSEAGDLVEFEYGDETGGEADGSDPQ